MRYAIVSQSFKWTSFVHFAILFISNAMAGRPGGGGRAPVAPPPTPRPSRFPSARPTPGDFVDCRESCLFPDTYIVQPVNPVLFVNLPQTFTMKFEYQCPGSPSSTEVGNIFDIYSLSNQKSLLSVYLMMNSNQIGIDYNGVTVMKYGPPASFSFNSFVKFTITVTEKNVILDNGGYDQWVPIPGTVSSKENVIYMSSRVFDARHVSAMGTIRNILFEGPLCCASTSYYRTNWQSCSNAADGSLSAISSCSSCAAYQCIDWTVGSHGMRQREEVYFNNSGDSVYFAVGSYGYDDSRAGKCYRISSPSIDRDVIAQVVTQGHRAVSDGNFEILMAAGGFGYFEACSGSTVNNPQFYGQSLPWVAAANMSKDCQSIPDYPICGKNPVDNLRSLCAWSYSAGFRSSGGTPAVISQMCEVSCPDELWPASGLHRADEPTNSFVCDGSTTIVIPVNETTQLPTGFLTSRMDCGKPTYASADRVYGPTFPGSTQVIPCRRDGYSRINSIPTLAPTASPTYPVTLPPTMRPTRTPTWRPTYTPTAEPTESSTSYPTYNTTDLSAVNAKGAASFSSSQSFFTDLHSPYLYTVVALAAVLLAFIAIICICERRLHVEKFRELNEKKASKARAKAEKQAVTAPLLLSSNSNSPKKSPIKMASFRNPLMYKNVAINDMEIIL